MKYDIPQSLYHLFIKQAEQTPAAIAVRAPSLELSYEQVAIAANLIATQLLGLGTKRDQLIGVVMEKGWEQIVAVLGILQSGAAFLPIDPNISNERIQHLIVIGEVKIILTQSEYQKQIEWPENVTVVNVDASLFEQNKSPMITCTSKLDDLAYVIFTSGSTGVPKGVMIDHRGALNTILDINDRFNIQQKDNIFAISALNFDLSVYDIFGLLGAGGTIVLPHASDIRDPTRWDKQFFDEKITIWNSVPALMDMFVEHVKYKYAGKIPGCSLRLVLLSGDWIPINLPSKIHSVFPNVSIISLGGATEASIWSILYPIHKIDPEWKSIPYGKPMRNQNFYILKDNLEPVVNNEMGELYIGGTGLAKGYWRDDEKTKAQFIQHPVYGRIYKTGDLGRYLPDGNIEFLGRADYQVKIGGFRIELSGIEKSILDFPGIERALVLAEGDHQQKKLVAYIVLKDNKKDSTYSKQSQTDQVFHWQQIYDALCIAKNPTQDPYFNTVGWTDSYNGETIPEIQMREWAHHTVDRIMQLKPKKVLEIGCGTGLLLFQIAPRVEQYDATDFSASVIAYVDEYVKKLQLKNINLFQCEAKQFRAETYDTIILNSVIQYFPSCDYLYEVLKNCIEHIKDQGVIFIGDVRSLIHLRAYHTSINLNNIPNDMSYSEWNVSIQKQMGEEDELLLDFHFFYCLKKIFPRITNVEVLLKQGQYQNEMNRFRYDVILHINRSLPQAQNVQWQDWEEQNFNLEKVNTILSNKNLTCLNLKNIPNIHTVGLNKITHWNPETVPSNWKEELHLQLQSTLINAIDPQSISEICASHGYNAKSMWSKENPVDCFDTLILNNNIAEQQFEFLDQHELNACKDWHEYANTPLKVWSNRQLIMHLKTFLRLRLSDYMVPQTFIILKEFPINTNGKIDRNALPRPSQSARPAYYVAPQTKTQKQLALIWSKILGLERIGIHDHYYEVGGTSLLAVRILIEIHTVFGVELGLQELKTSPTIEKLSQLILEKLAQITKPPNFCS